MHDERRYKRSKIAQTIMQYVREETKASGVRIGHYPVDFEDIERVEALTKLDPDRRKTLYQIINTFLRDATARKAYAVLNLIRNLFLDYVKFKTYRKKKSEHYFHYSMLLLRRVRFSKYLTSKYVTSIVEAICGYVYMVLIAINAIKRQSHKKAY